MCEICYDSSLCPNDESSMCNRKDQNDCMEELFRNAAVCNASGQYFIGTPLPFNMALVVSARVPWSFSTCPFIAWQDGGACLGLRPAFLHLSPHSFDRNSVPASVWMQVARGCNLWNCWARYLSSISTASDLWW